MTETTVTKEQITWEPLPADFELPLAIFLVKPNKYVGFHCVPPDLQENGEGIGSLNPVL